MLNDMSTRRKNKFIAIASRVICISGNFGIAAIHKQAIGKSEDLNTVEGAQERFGDKLVKFLTKLSYHKNDTRCVITEFP